MSHRIVGLDIGSTALRAVEVEDAASPRPTIVRFAEALLPEGAVRAGEVVDAATVTATLKSMWSSAGFKSKDVVVGTGNSKVLARDMTVPKVPIAQIRESLQFQVQDLLPVPAADALLDFYPMTEIAAEAGPQLKGMLVAAIKAPVLRNVETVQAAGLKVLDVDLIPFALSRLFAGDEHSDPAQLIVHLGAASTVMVALVGRVPHLIRIMPSGGIDITRSIAQRMDVAMTDAEATKRAIGVVPSNASDAQRGALEVTFEIVNETLVSVRDTILYFASSQPTTPIDRIVLSGGGAHLQGLAAALGEYTRLEVAVPDPLALATPAKGLRGTGDPFAMSVALGLAIGVPA